MRLGTTKTDPKMLLAKRIVATLTLAAAATVGANIITPAPAQAIPSNCSETVRPQSNAAVCKSGTGYYRAWARCTHQNSKKVTTRYGWWRGVGGIASNASCGSLEFIVSSKDHGITRTNHIPPY